MKKRTLRLTTTAIFLLGKGEAYIMVIMRCAINAIYQGNIMAFAFSFSAGTVSYLVMVALISLKVFSLVGVSSVSAITHNFIQVVVASFITGSTAVFAYLPYLIVIGGIVGAFIGLISYYIVKKYPVGTLIGQDNGETDKITNVKSDSKDADDLDR